MQNRVLIKRFVVGLALAASTFGTGACTPSKADIEPTTVASAPSTPTVYPVPEGCPSAKDLGQAAVKDPNKDAAISEALLNYLVATPLPAGGCAYITSDVMTSTNSSATYRMIDVWFFNMDTPGRMTTAALGAWAKSAGGTPVNGNTTDFKLPEDFTNWTKSSVDSSDGFGIPWQDESAIPAYRQGKNAVISFAVNASDSDNLVRLTAAGVTTYDPTKALSMGFPASYTGSFTMTDDQNYTALVKVSAKLPTITADPTNAPPGKFYAILKPTVTFTETNTTAARNTQTSPISVVALYPKGSAGCTGQNGVDRQSYAFCEIVLGSTLGVDLAADATQNPPSEPGSTRLGVYSEASASLAQLNAPVAFYAYLPYSLRHWKAEKGCAANNRWYVPMSGSPDVLCK